jgi:hypothetical protein
MADTFISPYGMMRNSNKPSWVWKAVFSTSSVCILIVGVHPHLVVVGAQVQFGEESGTMQFVEQLFDNQYREFILHRVIVEHPIIDAKAPGAIVLLDEEDGCRERQRTWPDDVGS